MAFFKSLSGKQLKELIHRHEGESNDEGDEPVEEETKSSLEETEGILPANIGGGAQL